MSENNDPKKLNTKAKEISPPSDNFPSNLSKHDSLNGKSNTANLPTRVGTDTRAVVNPSSSSSGVSKSDPSSTSNGSGSKQINEPKTMEERLNYTARFENFVEALQALISWSKFINESRGKFSHVVSIDQTMISSSFPLAATSFFASDAFGIILDRLIRHFLQFSPKKVGQTQSFLQDTDRIVSLCNQLFSNVFPSCISSLMVLERVEALTLLLVARLSDDHESKPGITMEQLPIVLDYVTNQFSCIFRKAIFSSSSTAAAADSDEEMNRSRLSSCDDASEFE